MSKTLCNTIVDFTGMSIPRSIDPCDLPQFCDIGTIIPDPKNCYGYLMCANGISWTPMNCPEGTCFDSDQRACLQSCTCHHPCPFPTGQPTTSTTEAPHLPGDFDPNMHHQHNTKIMSRCNSPKFITGQQCHYPPYLYVSCN